VRRFLPAMANSSSSTFFCGNRADPRVPDGSNMRIRCWQTDHQKNASPLLQRNNARARQGGHTTEGGFLLDTRSPTQIILITGVRRRQGSARETLRRENPGRDPDPPPHACHGCGYALANAGHDTRAIQDWLGHRSIQYTVRYTELSPTRFKDFWRN
jgi:hypothetical protein